MKRLSMIIALAGCGLPDASEVTPPCKQDADCAAFGDEFAGRRCLDERCVVDLCGDGVVDPGEACDDGNLLDTDSCTAACQEAVCGDGILRSDLSAGQQGFEACEDGNTVDNDDCTNACTIATCGDGIVWEGREACDDGNDNNEDDCTNECTSANCGDGVVQAGEQCDDGNVSDTDACRNNCLLARCGDGVVRTDLDSESEDFESCDDGNEVDVDGCSNRCRVTGCGDGIVQPGEDCDDGNESDLDACRNSCERARCGDGVVRTDLSAEQEGFEACDDGNNNNADGCSNACRRPGCGDGIRQQGEACDDGNLIATDECTANCEVARCGDGVVRAGVEECDDANQDDQDGCRNSCEAARCGDGVVRLDLDPGEEGYEGCDGGDGCSRRCEPLPVGLFAGAHFTCAILSGGQLVCWGDNRYDQLGNSAFGQSDFVAVPVAVEGLTNVQSGAAGDRHACAVQNSTLYCWGSNFNGRLGLGQGPSRTTPTRVTNRVDKVAIGQDTTCILRQGSVSCWGRNQRGQLGNNTTDDASLPVPVQIPSNRGISYLSGMAHITVGSNFACASDAAVADRFPPGQVPSDHRMFCWGDATLGRHATLQSPEAGYRTQAVESDHQVAAPMAGANHVCGGRRWVPGRLGVWSSVGGVHCWGSDEPQNQQLGVSTSPANSAASPRQADYGDGNSASSSVLLAAGWNHNLVKISDRLFCFGANDELQCGQAWGATVSSPRQVEGLVVSGVGAAGERHSCVMTSDDAVRCWGMNDRGQLGRGASGPSTASSDVVVTLAGNAN